MTTSPSGKELSEANCCKTYEATERVSHAMSRIHFKSSLLKAIITEMQFSYFSKPVTQSELKWLACFRWNMF